MKWITRLTSDLAFMLPHARPNIPPLEYIQDGVFLGYSEYLNTPVFLDLNKLIAPAGIFVGKIRTGKSTTAKAILIRQHLQYRTNLLIFDAHGEYSDLTKELGGTVIDMKQNTLNPCKLSPNLSNKQKALQLTDMLNTVFQFSDVQFATILDYITRGYETHGEHLTFEILIRMIREDFAKKSRDTITLGAILRRIEMLSGNIFGDENSFPMEQIVNGFICLDVSKIDNNHLRNMAMLSVLQYIYNTMLANQGQQKFDLEGPIRLLIMIDEAGRIASDPSSVVTRLVKESGKFRIGLFFGIQDIPDIDSKIFSNYGFVVIHKLDNHEYIHKIQQDCSFTPELASRIRSLPVGTAFLKLNFKDASIQSPFIVRVEMERPQKQDDPAKTEEILTPSAKKDEPSGPTEVIRQENHDSNLSDDAERLLEKISKEPNKTTTWYYQQLGFSAYRGNKAKNEIADLIESKEIPTVLKLGRTGKLLQLSQKGRAVMQINFTNRHGGVLHNSLVDKIAKKFEGYNVEKEFSIGEGKQIDLSINRKLAFEFESRSFSESNVRKALEYGFDRIIVVCLPANLEKFRKSLETAKFENSKVDVMTVKDVLTKTWNLA